MKIKNELLFFNIFLINIFFQNILERKNKKNIKLIKNIKENNFKTFNNLKNSVYKYSLPF
jgi:hypothetical protein